MLSALREADLQWSPPTVNVAQIGAMQNDVA
jgi:hypothetical protein